MVVGGVATAITTFGYGLMNFMLGIDAPVSFLLLRQILATIILNALIALPVFALVRRWLSPVLPEDPRRRRRRAYTTGGLSPLSRA
jgi:membrane protein implicated in regulation of membrane protease activity